MSDPAPLRAAASGKPRRALLLCRSGQRHARLVGGLTLIERLLRQLSALDLAEVVVALPDSETPPAPTARVSLPLRWLRIPGDDPATALGVPADERFVVLASDLLVDSRLLAWLAACDHDVVLTPAPEAPFECAGAMTPGALRALLAGGPGGPKPVSASDFPTYWVSRRGEVPVHLMRVCSGADARRAESVLLDHADKRTKDLPAIWFDPPFENACVRAVAPTRITPNQITLVTALAGFAVAVLLWRGWFTAGLVLAVGVEILDGVDGKLARVKLMTSRLGELEHVLDFFYENAWYLGLGAGLAAAGSSWAWPAAWGLCAADLADNMAYLLYARRGGGNLDEAGIFPRRFRLVAGRRNIYVWMMLPGALAGATAGAFAAAVSWAAATATVHWTLALAGPRRLTGAPEATCFAPGANAAATAAGRRPRAPERFRRAG